MSFEDMPSYADGQQLQADDNIVKTEGFASSNSDDANSSAIEAKSTSVESKNDFDQELYDNILEKLDIKKVAQKQDIANGLSDGNDEVTKSSKYQQSIDKLEKTKQIEQSVLQDVGTIKKLVQKGLINSAQGQNLKKVVLKNAFDKLVMAGNKNNSLKESVPTGLQNFGQVLEDFSKNNPSFFEPNGRREVLDYLKSAKVSVGEDELNKISNIIRGLEKTAIDRYLQKVSYEKTLKDSNQAAKQRLTANAQKSGSVANLSRPFTRDEIGRMSSAEFAKYESIIMKQLKKGLIK